MAARLRAATDAPLGRGAHNKWRHCLPGANRRLRERRGARRARAAVRAAHEGGAGGAGARALRIRRSDCLADAARGRARARSNLRARPRAQIRALTSPASPRPTHAAHIHTPGPQVSRSIFNSPVAAPHRSHCQQSHTQRHSSATTRGRTQHPAPRTPQPSRAPRAANHTLAGHSNKHQPTLRTSWAQVAHLAGHQVLITIMMML